MEAQSSPSPLTITEYCARFGFALADVRIPCNFCRSYLCVQDCAAFDLKQFRLLWKNAFCYACCRACMRLSAAYEVERFIQCICDCKYVTDLVKKPLKCIPMRCLLCLALLDFSEKLEHLFLNEPFTLVRGNWRGFCRNCIRKV